MENSKIQWTDATLKRCYKCQTKKLLSEFSIDRSRHDGKKAKCITCCRVKNRVNMKGRISSFKGKSHPESARVLMRINNARSGNPNWKGGITNLVVQIRNMQQFKDWRMNVYHSGKFTCSECGIKKSGNNIILDADHLYPLSKIIFDNKIQSPSDALKVSLLWDVTNGRCLCRECHKKTDSWGVNVNRIKK